MHTTLEGGDAVGETVNTVGLVTRVPAEGDLDFLSIAGLGVPTDVLEQRFLGAVQVQHEISDATFVAVHQFLEQRVSFVHQMELEAGVEESHHLEPFGQGLRSEVSAFFEDRGIGPEPDGGAGSRAAVVVDRGVADDVQLLVGHPAIAEGHEVALTHAVDLDLDQAGQRIHDGDTDAVQATGNLVAVASELAAGV